MDETGGWVTRTEAARRLGVSRSTVYDWCDRGKLASRQDGKIGLADVRRLEAEADTVLARAVDHGTAREFLEGRAIERSLDAVRDVVEACAGFLNAFQQAGQGPGDRISPELAGQLHLRMQELRAAVASYDRGQVLLEDALELRHETARLLRVSEKAVDREGRRVLAEVDANSSNTPTPPHPLKA